LSAKAASALLGSDAGQPDKQITGTIPSSLGMLTRLSALVLLGSKTHGSELTGAIQTDTALTFGGGGSSISGTGNGSEQIIVSIQFDCPDQVSERLKLNLRDFIKEVFLNNTNIGARLVHYCGRYIEVEKSKISLEIEEYKIAVPSNCRYANKLYIPLLIKNDNMNEKDLQTFIKPYSVNLFHSYYHFLLIKEYTVY